jgi:hypothetical protein
VGFLAASSKASCRASSLVGRASARCRRPASETSVTTPSATCFICRRPPSPSCRRLSTSSREHSHTLRPCPDCEAGLDQARVAPPAGLGREHRCIQKARQRALRLARWSHQRRRPRLYRAQLGRRSPCRERSRAVAHRAEAGAWEERHRRCRKGCRERPHGGQPFTTDRRRARWISCLSPLPRSAGRIAGSNHPAARRARTSSPS